MGLFSRLFYLSPRARLPRLRHHYTNGRKLDDKDESVHLLLEAGLMRDWTHAKKLIKTRHKPVDELYWELSRAALPNWRKRLKNRLIRAFGAMPYDPHKAEIKKIEKGDYSHDGPHTRAYRIMPSPRNKRERSRHS